MTSDSQTRVEIPEYLRVYVVEQDPTLYTPMDHAAWRYILKLSKVFFEKHAHAKYLSGLQETGISTEKIPLISEMDNCLSRFGWRAVAVSGFIPPAVFMEFLSRGVLPIACDMRKLEHLSYTPAPDIVHEAAGHAPIIADPEYAKYLKHYGELAEKAIFSAQDLDVYHAVRGLSETKEDPNSTPEQIEMVQKKLDDAVRAIDHVSEAAQLGRMGWWTIEYGLIGTFDHPKIYGAGLLSSLGESLHCFDSEVKKIPFSLQCVDTPFDITRPQPQLFISPDFETLKEGLDLLAEKMAFKSGGKSGLLKAQKAKVTTTSVLDSGVQISGTLESIYEDDYGNPIFLKFLGPTQLSYERTELDGQGPNTHAHGFSAPIGRVKMRKEGSALHSPDQLTQMDLGCLGFKNDGVGKLEFESGIALEGQLIQSLRKQGRLLVLTFQNCTIRQGVQVLYRPEWGNFDLACGSKVISVFGGAADRNRYLEVMGGFQQNPRVQKSNLTPNNLALCELYGRVREIRETAGKTPSPFERKLEEVFRALEENYPEDWLLRYELLELIVELKLKVNWESKLRTQLKRISMGSQEKSEMINRGLEVL